MPTTCDIDFENNPQKVIYAGQLLRGTVRLTLTEEKTVRGIYIRIDGKAYAHWSTGSGKNRRSYSGSEDYLTEKTYFLGGSEGSVPSLNILQMKCIFSTLSLCYFCFFN